MYTVSTTISRFLAGDIVLISNVKAEAGNGSVGSGFFHKCGSGSRSSKSEMKKYWKWKQKP